jgi:hypothetical protein
VLAVYFAPSGTVGVLKADEAKSNWPLQARARGNNAIACC